MNMADRISATPAAQALIALLTSKHGPVMFFQSGGCCENSAPLCYPEGEFKLSPSDVYLGNVCGTPYYMGGRDFEFWQNSHLIVDVVDGRSGTFALDGPEGKTFICRSRLFTDAELAELEAQAPETAQPSIL
jgi:uncharacterized protein (DUF779 family)